MIKGLIFMDWAGYSGTTIGDMLGKWEQAGIFSYILPFLVLFALIFGILNQIKLFKDNRAINAIIALAVGLMALQFEFVPRFFAEVFPRLGIGLAILLVILILVGLFIDPDKPGIMYTLLAIGLVIVVVVLINAGAASGYDTGYWWKENWDTILGIIIFLVIFGLIVFSGTKPSDKPYKAFMVRGGE